MPKKRKRSVNPDTIQQKRSANEKETKRQRREARSSAETATGKIRHAQVQKRYAAKNREEENARCRNTKASASLQRDEQAKEEWNEKARVAMARLRQVRAMEEGLKTSGRSYDSIEEEPYMLDGGYEQCDPTVLLDDFIL